MVEYIKQPYLIALFCVSVLYGFAISSPLPIMMIVGWAVGSKFFLYETFKDRLDKR